MNITWTDGQESGWAYGQAVDDPDKMGYFPQAVMKEVKCQLSNHRVGEKLSVIEEFQAPEDIGGYLTVVPGDVLKILHPMDHPYVWAYVEHCNPQGSHLFQGWVPGSCFGEAADLHRSYQSVPAG